MEVKVVNGVVELKGTVLEGKIICAAVNVLAAKFEGMNVEQLPNWARDLETTVDELLEVTEELTITIPDTDNEEWKG